MLINQINQVGLIIYKLCNINNNFNEEQNLLDQNFKSVNEDKREKMNKERLNLTFGAKEIKNDKKIIEEQVNKRKKKNQKKKNQKKNN